MLRPIYNCEPLRNITVMPTPDVVVRGPSEDPQVTIVGGVHGDEPSGVTAIENLREADLEYQRSVQLVVANPPAVEADERFIESDLNRSFPGDPDGTAEEQIAHELCELAEGTVTLALHATHSTPEPFALVDRQQREAVELATQLPVNYVIDHSDTTDGSFTACNTVIGFEAGCQYSENAARTATETARHFLQVVDALPGKPPATETEFYSMEEPVVKPDSAPDGVACDRLYSLHVDNFEHVPAGTTYATMDGEPVIADEDFYPILMSECGYQDVFGYRGSKIADSLEEFYARSDGQTAE
jgi:predicted deacylase